MKKIDLKMLIITCLVCLLPIFIGIVFYNQLPEKVAIHFNINNEPDGYFSKPAFVFGMPAIMVVIQSFCCIVNDVQDKNAEANKKAVRAFKWIIPIITVILYTVTIVFALGNTLDIRRIVMIMLGLEFIVLGNYTPKTKGQLNGMKKLNEEDYKKIARPVGYMLIIDGVLCFISILFNKYVSIAIIPLLIIQGIALYIYTYRKNKK